MMAVSYEELMEKKLDRIDDRRDKRQGSLIYDALAPNAAETAQFYADLDLLADRTFADTAVGEDLTRRGGREGNAAKGRGEGNLLRAFSGCGRSGISCGKRDKICTGGI